MIYMISSQPTILRHFVQMEGSSSVRDSTLYVNYIKNKKLLKDHHHIHNSTLLVPVPSQDKPVKSLPLCFFTIKCNITLLLRLCLRAISLLRFFARKPSMNFSSLPPCHIRRPSHSS